MVNSIKITDYITEDLIDLDLKSKNRDEILVELSKLLEKSDNIVGKENDILKALVDREKLGSTGIGKGVHLFFVFASPSKDSHIYLKVLARISRLIREEDFRDALFNCKTAKEIIECIKEKEE